jgi:hypothetical protein
MIGVPSARAYRPWQFMKNRYRPTRLHHTAPLLQPVVTPLRPPPLPPRPSKRPPRLHPASLEPSLTLPPPVTISASNESTVFCYTDPNHPDLCYLVKVTTNMPEFDLHLRVHDHPNIATVHSRDKSRFDVVGITDFYPLGDLFNYITRPEFVAWPDTTVRGILQQAVDAIAHCHARGIAHRDIKLENLCIADISPHGTVDIRLIDFGHADCIHGQNGSARNVRRMLGTKTTMAPELLHSAFSTIDTRDLPATDVWSLGVTVYGIATLTEPWALASARECAMYRDYREMYTTHALREQWMLDNGVPASLAGVLAAMLDPNPSTRITLPALQAVLAESS